MSSIAPKTETGDDRQKQIDHCEVEREDRLHNEVGDRSDVGHNVGGHDKDTGGRSRVGGEVTEVVVDGDQPNDQEKFVQGIGRKQSTAMSRSGESSPYFLLVLLAFSFFLVSIYDSLTKFFPRPGMHLDLCCR